jgi:hypothetical protein
MKKSDLKNIMAQWESLGISDDAEVQIQYSVDNSLHSLQNLAFDAKGKDASYSIGPDGHWAEAVSQANVVILKE